MTNTVLLIEDDAVLRRSIAQSITLEQIEVIIAGSYEIAADHLHYDFNGIVLTDIRMEGKDGFDVLRLAQKCDADIPVVMLTGHGDVAMAVRAVQKGAFDFLEKPCHPDHLMRVLKKALIHRRLVMRVRQLERQTGNEEPSELVFPGTSSAVRKLRHELNKFSLVPVNIHLWGESGSGRSLAAACLHKLSGTKNKLVEMNLTDLNADLHQECDEDNEPVFYLFKNIELATVEQQERVSEFINTDTENKVITTSLSAPHTIPETQLSKQLYYCVSVAQVEVPSLRSRSEDIVPTFLSILQQQAEIMALPVPEISPKKLMTLTSRSWDGNIAELRQHARKVILKLDDGIAENDRQSLALRMRKHEMSILEDALKRHRGRTANVAEELSIPVKTLYDRLARHGLKSNRYR